MTVAQLIEKLKTCPQDLATVICDDDGNELDITDIEVSVKLDDDDRQVVALFVDKP